MKKYNIISGRVPVVSELMNKRWLCDINFFNRNIYDDAVKNGFDAVIWEEKNMNKILIEHKPYLEVIK